MNKLFDDAALKDKGTDSPAWVPVMDIYETPGAFVVTAELPGVRESDIAIRVEGNILRIAGRRTPCREGRSYHQVERCYGDFSRSFLLPAMVDTDMVKATLKDGILEVTLLKKSGEPSKHIEIT